MHKTGKLCQWVNSQCETLQVDSVQEETANLDREVETCMQIPLGSPYKMKKNN